MDKAKPPSHPIENPWKTLSSREVYDNDWISLVEYDVVNPGGGRSIYGKVSFKNLAIGIIPMDREMNTWLVGQYRYTLDDYSWEIPMGGGPLHADPLESAKRELKEETGISASKWMQIMEIHTSNSVTDEMGYVFLAEELVFGKSDLEETEKDLQIRKLPFQEALGMVISNEITDAISVAGLLKVARLKNV